MKLLIKARSQAGARPRRGALCPKCGHSELHHHHDRLKRSMWVGPCRSCGPFQKGRCEGAQFKVEEIAKAQPKDDGDRPEYGKVYSLTGPRSIASGDTWQGSEVWCGGTRSDHSAYGCRAKADHEHVGPDHIRHMRGAAKINGCTPDRCGKKAEKAGDEAGCKEPGCPLPTANHRSTTPNFATSKDQVYEDGWRNKHRALRFKGKCVGCGSRTYGFDDGENDPRGVLGDRHATSAEYAEDHGYPAGLKEVPACFGCMNDHARYDKVMRIAHATWGKNVGSGGSVPDKLPKDISDMGKSAQIPLGLTVNHCGVCGHHQSDHAGPKCQGCVMTPSYYRFITNNANAEHAFVARKIEKARTPSFYALKNRRGRILTHYRGGQSQGSYSVGSAGLRSGTVPMPNRGGSTLMHEGYSSASAGRMMRLRDRSSGIMGKVRQRLAGAPEIIYQKSDPTNPTEVRPVGKTPWKWARERSAPAKKWATSSTYKKERTNPAAAAQIADARANRMGDLGKGFGSEDCPVCGDEMYSPEEMAEHRASHDSCKACGHERANHVAGFSYDGTRAHCTDCRREKRQKMDADDPSFQMIQPYHSIQATKFGKARKPDQYPPAYPDGFVTEVGRDTRICKSCGMPSGDHVKGCKGGGTEKVSDQVVKKAGVVFGTRPFARRALPKGQLSRERAGAPRYRKALSCVCGDAIGSHIGDGGCASCQCAAFKKAQPVYVLRMRKSESVEVPEIPKCDFHPSAPAYADARLPSVGSWANVCKDCFHAHGASLGTGRGQVYMAEGRSKPQAKKSKMPPCPRCEAGDFTRDKREDGLRHRATVKTPSMNTVMKWDFDGSHKATDGCKVEGDGQCKHGHQSWIRRMGIM